MDQRLLDKNQQRRFSDLDVIYEKISENAKYPIILCLLLSVVLWVAAGCFLTSDVILAAKPDGFDCIEVNGQTVFEQVDPCAKNCTEWANFKFNSNWTTGTILTHFELICGKEKNVNDFKTGTMMGLFPGVLAAGTISDKFGRKRTIIVVALMASVAAVLTRFLAPYNVGLYIIGRILMNGCAHGASVIGFVYVIEMSSPRFRTQIGMFVCGVIFAFGVVLGSVLAWMFDSWETMLISMACLPLFIIPFIPILPESFRWYFSTGRYEKGRKSLKTFARRCGVKLGNEFLSNVVRAQKSDDTKENRRVIMMIWELFRNPITRKVVLKMFFLWMVIVMFYFALLLGDLPGSVIFNNAVNGGMEGLGALFAILAIKKDWFLRTKSIMILLLISGIFTLCSALFQYLYQTESDVVFQETLRRVFLSFSFLSFLAMSATFAILFVYTGEMFPTVIRASSFAVCSLGGRFGSLIAPQISKLTYLIPGLHGAVFTILTFIGAYICSSLPETQGRELMQTLEETEEFFQVKKRRSTPTDSSREDAIHNHLDKL